MSNPQGPDRHTAHDADATEQTGEIPAWGTPPPGGWGADPESTGAWSPERDGSDTGAAPADTGAWAQQESGAAGWGAQQDPAATGWGAQQDGAAEGWGTQQNPATGDWPAQPDNGAGGWGAQQDPAAGGWGAQQDPAAAGWGTQQDGAAGGWGGAQPVGTAGAPPQQEGALWGDEAPSQDDTWAVPTGRRRRRRAADEPADAVPASSPASAWAGDTTTAQPADGGWGADQPWAPPEQVKKPSGARTWILIGGAVLLVAVLALSAFVWPAWAITRHLDQTALQAGVNQVLTEDYGLEVGAVQCPDDVVVSAGTAFSCQAVVDGEQVEVPGLVTSDEGDYQINRV
ncbi:MULTISPECIES: DUF4333 domain-containing protein [Pseudonocardia]|uniref:DUF4333 domain-containing protein n=2 Tax=Pseudonocardia TaxID=1847 RepID=A0A1Y2N2X8_PSEAH|nr:MULTISPECIES: DUF4333 domain-containing protein [Pseudonocardia]OSY41541.1 hypothetical protein BG845_02032 [Pseudonocardia autotrophica]TDN71496.1 uncharacterized protein DUF4333 [Pseudonocardia autotrophica]BBG02174.1 hypothetical protein Pdca_33830 [Pseudonocardia autotrophica]GEC24188.1 hypothetical protein PSA01_12170 [Pseudonocardia saturnea]